jgi:hypothetical protein
VTRRRSLRLALTLCAPDWLHIKITHAPYHREVARGAGPNIFYTLFYAEDDRPLDMPTPMERTAQPTDVRTFGDHFFLVTQVQ